MTPYGWLELAVATLLVMVLVIVGLAWVLDVKQEDDDPPTRSGNFKRSL